MFEPVSLDELEQWHHDDIFLILGLGHIRITNDIQTTIAYKYPQFDRINCKVAHSGSMSPTGRGLYLGGYWKEDIKEKGDQINWG